MVVFVGQFQRRKALPDDLVERVRDFARRNSAEIMSSAFLSANLDVDVRTIAAALRRFDVRPKSFGSTRGYVVAELANVGLVDPGVERAADAAEIRLQASPVGDAVDEFLADPTIGEIRSRPSAIAALSAGAGHDMTPALKAAGLM